MDKEKEKETKNKGSMRKYMASLYVLLGMIALTFYVIFRNYELGDVFKIAHNADHRLLLAACIMILGHLVLGARALQLLLKSMHRPTGLFACCRYCAIDFYFSAVTPSATGGQPVQAFYMAKDGISYGISTVALVLILIVYKIVLVLLGIGALIFRLPYVIDHGVLVTLLYVLGLLFNVAMIVFALCCIFSPTLLHGIVSRAIRWLSRHHIIKRPEKTMETFENYSQEMRKAADYIRDNRMTSLHVFLVTLLQRLCLFSVSYLVYRSLHLSGAGFFDLVFIQVVISISVDSLPFPGGVGATEAVFLVLYHGIYTSSMLVSAMMLTRGIAFYLYLIIAALITVANQLALMHEQRKLAGY